MKILLLCQYYFPEEQNIFVHECASELVEKGHDVTVLTAFPHYGKGRIYDGYRGRLVQREQVDGVQVVRSWVYATPKKGFYPRVANFGSFCASSLLAALPMTTRPDVVYAWMPPLPLGVTAAFLARVWKTRLVVHIQDLYPRVAIDHGILTNQKAIRFFEAMERYVYRKSDRIIVISQGIRQHLLSKGLPADKVSVVENWADPTFIKTGGKDNSFRRELDVNGRFLLIYSGGLNNNANVEPVIQAADLLRDEPFFIAIVGEGQYKEKLEREAQRRALKNVKFLPFQPFERYPEVLNAADMNLVALSSRSALSSVPSKIYKQMAAGRPILAITPETNELFRLVSAAECGVCVPPDDALAVAETLRWAASHPEQLCVMGAKARTYLQDHHSLERSGNRISEILNEVVNGASNQDKK